MTNLIKECERLALELATEKARSAQLEAALQKIDEPKKYHHVETDAYTRAGCFQFVAHEALKLSPSTSLNAIRKAQCALGHYSIYKSEPGKDGAAATNALDTLNEVFGEIK